MDKNLFRGFDLRAACRHATGSRRIGRASKQIAYPALGVCQGIGCLAGSYDRKISAFDAATVGSENT
jgi:hypothetical protein